MSNEKWDKSKFDNFTIKYNGDATAKHEMNADELANSLLGLSGVLENSNITIQGSNSDIFVKVRGAPRPGSFEVDIVTMLTCSGMVAVLNMVDILGFIGGTAKSLIWLYRQSKGNDIKSIENIDNDNVQVHFNGCSNPVYANKYVVEIYNDRNVRRDFSKLVSPLKNEGISDISFVQNGIEHEKICKDELEIFDYDEDSDPSSIEGTSEFLITQFNIYGKPSGWKLSCVNSTENMYDEKEFRVKMLDHSFLNKVKNKVIIISNEKPTIIKATYRLTIHKMERTVTNWEILKVWDYTHEKHKYKSINKHLHDF